MTVGEALGTLARPRPDRKMTFPKFRELYAAQYIKEDGI